ncbi:hypothetical protein [Stenotrophomonas maltophilia]|uniref:hypothetical protein n=1 Tax=Stenotrophomonas maltophilia TaxID=40324 RepID=UPI002E75B91B|nr:hypothetical protein [Stenotrophomonas maltophilia]
MTSAIQKLLTAFESDHPVVLFLGQDLFRINGSDSVLESLLKRVGRDHEEGLGNWKSVLLSGAVAKEDYEWLSERFDRRVPTEAVEKVFDLAWSGIFTSSLDHRVSGLLETRGRLPETVLAADHFSRAPRSKSRPAVHYLFGRAVDAEHASPPPRSKVELKRRLATHAVPLLNRIKETATGLGVVVIDGFMPDSDWLELDDLLASVSDAPAPAVLWFGAKNTDSPFVDQMIGEGTLTLESRSLAEVLESSPWPMTIESTVFGGTDGTISLQDSKFFTLSPTLRLRVEAVAAVVDDAWTDTPDTPPAQLKDLFQRFHGDFGGPRYVVEGVLRGFAIKRAFEASLFSATEALLKKGRDVDSFLILHGQSGTGKSIALARLAVELRTQLKVPVLFCWGRVPLASELDDFCGAAEEAGALGTVVLCDGNHSPSRYVDLTVGLKSKGRRVVVVGSSYRIEDEDKLKSQNYIHAPETLSPAEIEALSKLLVRYGHGEIASDAVDASGAYFLPLLYRYLTASRGRLAGGVTGEARAAEGVIRIRAQSVPRSRSQNTLLAEKLIQAGIVTQPQSIFEDDAGREESGAAARLIDYVMVAGRLDCAIPVNLLLRSLRKVSNENFDIFQIAYLFQELDLFRWRAGDPEGNSYLIQPRLQIEAELICRKRLADKDRELSCLIELLSSVRWSSVDQESEIQFALDLLHKLHRDGPRGKAYQAGYLKVARTLTTLRLEHHVIDARLMLQESAFRREALFASDKPDPHQPISDEDRDVILNEAREVVEYALAEVANGNLRAGRRARRNFLVERASIYGFLAVGLAKRKAAEQDVWGYYQAARTAVHQAISGSTAFHPIDVGLWTPADILRENGLSESHAAELRADILSTLDQASGSVLGGEALVSLRTRKMKVANVLDDAVLSDEAFEELRDVNPEVAYFLRAREMANKVLEDQSEEPSPAHIAAASNTVAFLEQHLDSVRNDVRSLQLLLQMKWICLTGKRLFARERCRVPHESSEQKQLLSIVSDLNHAAGEGARNSNRLLQATLEWLVGDVYVAREQFRQLSSDSDFEDPARVLRRLLLEAPGSGFSGKIRRQRSEGHWDLQVSGLNGEVDLLTRDFLVDDPKPGRDVRSFNIAFNYLGPIADPVGRHGDKI